MSREKELRRFCRRESCSKGSNSVLLGFANSTRSFSIGATIEVKSGGLIWKTFG